MDRSTAEFLAQVAAAPLPPEDHPDYATVLQGRLLRHLSALPSSPA
jgi:hypothetical protein